MTGFLARLSGVEKRFGGVSALRGAYLELEAGRIHGVLGENGAGKSTLLGVLGGMVRPDAGVVEVAGIRRELRTPRDAWGAGVGMVHQHFTLVPPLTVLENLALGRRSAARGLRLPYGELRQEAEALMERTGLRVPLEAVVGTLGVGSRQRVEILKTLLRRPEILILDEPTAVLAPAEVETLFSLLRELAGEGRGVVLVAHKLDEVFSVADAVTVLRDGVTVASGPASEMDVAGVIRAMVGTDRADGAAVGHLETVAAPPPLRAEPGSVVAGIAGLRVRGERGEWAVDGASLEVRRGELVGIAGVEGNGQRELARALVGLAAPDAGRVTVPPRVAFIPQDRTREGLVADFDLTENVALSLHRNPTFRQGPWVRWDALRARTADLLRDFDVRAPGPGARARTLSGGNQQRVVVARELSEDTDLVVAENPTRGLDVGAAAFVHGELARVAREGAGAGVVLVSTDLDEVLALSHRVLVMVRGRLLTVPEERRTREGVGAYMLSGSADA